jgi:prevent-host-death family protein
MERFLGVEQARGRLGQLADEVSGGGEPVILSRRGQAVAVLVGRDEYAQFKEATAREARAELDRRLADVRKKVSAAGLEPAVVDEAIAAARRLP